MTKISAKAEVYVMLSFLGSELEEALEGMEDMIAYVPAYFREKWGHDEYLVRAREAVASYQAMKLRMDTLPSKPPRSPSAALKEPWGVEHKDRMPEACKRDVHTVRHRVRGRWLCSDCGKDVTDRQVVIN